MNLFLVCAASLIISNNNNNNNNDNNNNNNSNDNTDDGFAQTTGLHMSHKLRNSNRGPFSKLKMDNDTWNYFQFR